MKLYRALLLQFYIGLAGLAFALLTILLGPGEGLEALGGALALYFVFLWHLPMVPQVLWLIWKGPPPRFTFWLITVYLALFVGAGLVYAFYANALDREVADFIDSRQNPEGYEMRERARELYRDSVMGGVSADKVSELAGYISRAPDINGRDEYHAPVLWYLAHIGDPDLVSAAIERGANVNGEDTESSPLFVAAEKGHLDVVRLLIDAGADVNTRWRGQSALFVALKEEHVEVAFVLLENGVSLLDEGDAFGRAVRSGEAEIVQQMLLNGLPPTLVIGQRPIEIALDNEQMEMVAVLNEGGAGFDWGEIQDPLIFELIGRCDMAAVQQALDLGASPNVSNRRDEHVLAYAVMLRTRGCDYEAHRAGVVRLLAEAGADLSATTPIGHGLVAAALESGYVDVARLLVHQGAPLKPGYGKTTSLMLAARHDARDIVDAGIAAGLSATEWSDSMNSTSALLEAVRGLQPDMVRYLFELGATWKDDTSQRNAFRLAAKSPEVLEILVQNHERGDKIQDMWLRRRVEEHGTPEGVAVLERYGL